MDNTLWNKEAKRLIEIEEEHSDIQNILAIISLPPYLPDLNPMMEQVWRATICKKTHNHN